MNVWLCYPRFTNPTSLDDDATEHRLKQDSIVIRSLVDKTRKHMLTPPAITRHGLPERLD